MNKILYKTLPSALFLIFLLLIACNSTPKNEIDMQDENKTISLDTLSNNDTSDIIPDSIILPEVHDEGIGIQLPGLFRGYEPSDFDDLINGSWYELFYDSKVDKFFLTEGMARVTKEMDDCLGDSSTYISSKHEIEPMLFIKGLDEPLFKINSLVLKQHMIWPGQSMTFTFNNQNYALEAEGSVLSSEPVHSNDNSIATWQNVINYRLNLTSNVYGNVKKQLLIAIPSFNNTFVQVLFVGDLDNDGKPDFIFDISRDYEEKAVILMLSSRAKGDEFVRCVGESSYQFDC